VNSLKPQQPIPILNVCSIVSISCLNNVNGFATYFPIWDMLLNIILATCLQLLIFQSFTITLIEDLSCFVAFWTTVHMTCPRLPSISTKHCLTRLVANSDSLPAFVLLGYCINPRGSLTFDLLLSVTLVVPSNVLIAGLDTSCRCWNGIHG
jgi:hypothetical protein